MNIVLYCIGKLKENYWKEAVEEYRKRILSYANVEIVELNDLPIPSNASAAEEEAIKEKEGKLVLDKLRPNDYLVALDLGKKEIDSVKFAGVLQRYFEQGGAKVSFVIGGSLGLSESLKKRANDFLTLSPMTFPHQLTRVILLEQVYRAFRIINHQPYHK